MASKKSRAGDYAKQRFRQGLRSWRRRNRRLFAVLLGPLFAVGVAIVLLNGQLLSWGAGVAVGLAMTLWLVFRDTPPHYVENWRLGFEGERRTARELIRIERAGWHVAHDVQNGHGNYDHIAVGAAGVYLLDSKNLQGVVEIRDGVPYLRRRHDAEDERAWVAIPQRARRDAARLRGEIQERTGRRTWVQAVVVLWSEFPAGVVEEDRCAFVHGSRLRAWLQDRPSRLSQAEAEEVAAGIAGIARDAGAGEASPSATAPSSPWSLPAPARHG